MKTRLLAVSCLKTFSQKANKFIEKTHAFPDASMVLKPSWIKQREELNTKYIKSLDYDKRT